MNEYVEVPPVESWTWRLTHGGYEGKASITDVFGFEVLVSATATPRTYHLRGCARFDGDELLHDTVRDKLYIEHRDIQLGDLTPQTVVATLKELSTAHDAIHEARKIIERISHAL